MHAAFLKQRGLLFVHWFGLTYPTTQVMMGQSTESIVSYSWKQLVRVQAVFSSPFLIHHYLTQLRYSNSADQLQSSWLVLSKPTSLLHLYDYFIHRPFLIHMFPCLQKY